MTATDSEPKERSPSPFEPPKAQAHVIHPLSDVVKDAFRAQDEGVDFTGGSSLASALTNILKSMQVIARVHSHDDPKVGKICAQVVVKIVPGYDDFTEHTSLQYLERHKPQLPIPRTHGVIVMGTSAYLFTSFIPGVPVSHIWPSIDLAQKKSLAEDLDKILLDLRQLEKPSDAPLGGVGNEGCKDTRREARMNPDPLYSAKDFWDFQYIYNARAGREVYLEFLRRITIEFQASKCVFTHGDLRMDNIIVQEGDNQSYRISGIVDWETSGFYPEDFECTKITNTFFSNEESDWYLHLPPCVSPMRHPSRWLADRVWDRQVV